MWTILKIDKKKVKLLEEDLSKKFGKNFKIYSPKVIVERYSLNKLVKKEISVMT